MLPDAAGARAVRRQQPSRPRLPPLPPPPLGCRPAINGRGRRAMQRWASSGISSGQRGGRPPRLRPRRRLQRAERGKLLEECARARPRHVARKVGTDARVDLEDADLARRLSDLVVEVADAREAGEEGLHHGEEARRHAALTRARELLDVGPDVLRSVVLVRRLDVVEQLAVLNEQGDRVLDLAGDELLQQPLVVEASRHYLKRLLGRVDDVDVAAVVAFRPLEHGGVGCALQRRVVGWQVLEQPELLGVLAQPLLV
mmetsp:Transcript_27250/g.87515  ORF Transcript_27250/g.87515 Transcript_27250/m.87515 type:complete len:257 (-) Transcript_27250:417-1187(-)